MKIVVLDGYALNPGDLSWSGLEELGDLVVHDRSSPKEAIERAKDAEIVLTNKSIVGRELIERAENLRYIGVMATGFNIVEIEAASERGIPVTNVANYGTQSVAQMAFGHILNHCLHVADHGRDVAAGGWSACPDFAYWLSPLIELDGLTLGIVGPGEIGLATAKLGRAFGMKVIAFTRDPSREPPAGVSWASLDELFSKSDFVSLHCPLTNETENLVNEDRIRQMKRSAYLVNTSRGPLIDEEALAKALNEGRIAGAGLDVLSSEPPDQDNPLLKAKNCVITPHIAWASKSARERLLNMTVENLRSFLNGKTINQVNT